MATAKDYDTINTGTPIVMENVTVEMNVQKLANNYDAKQAGKDVLAEMVKIARKSCTQSVGR